MAKKPHFIATLLPCKLSIKLSREKKICTKNLLSKTKIRFDSIPRKEGSEMKSRNFVHRLSTSLLLYPSIYWLSCPQ